MRLKLIVFLAVFLALPAFGQTPQPAIPFAAGELQLMPEANVRCVEKSAKVITVPAGKFLILEQFSFLDNLALEGSKGQDGSYWAVTATTNGKVVTHFLTFDLVAVGMGEFFVPSATISLRIYADPGTTVTVSIYYPWPANGNGCFRTDTNINNDPNSYPMNWSLSGRLVSSIPGD